jgi:very-short-patch-repair endonuclease
MSAPSLLIKLLDYVLEQDKEVDPRGFKLSQHKGFIKAKPDLQGLPGVDFDIKVEGDHIWMRVARLEAARPPALSDERLEGLVVIGDDPSSHVPRIDEVAFKHWLAPRLQQRLPEERPAYEAQARESLNRALADYTPLWTAWAEGEKPRRRTISLYGDLFTIKHQLQSEETATPQELVWGIGVSSWKLSFVERSGSTVVDFQYPLLTQAVELALEEKTLAIEVRPRAVDPRFELDAFSACQLSSTADVEKAAREALARGADRPVNPFDPGSFEHLLKLVAGNMHERGRFTPGAHTFPPAGEDLVVSDAWAILARPRSNNYLHEDIERLKATLRAGADIPPGPLALVTPPSDETVTYEPVHFRGLSGDSSGGCGGEVEELYFPLPYNHEQITIAEQLERSTGVAVQGPPGTGKTHTIANIICHYLATGKKILVTSKGEQALEVLQSKIPEAVRPLTVALLAGDREGIRQFQTSIEAIIHNVSQLNIDVVREQIRTDHSAIDRAHAELATIDRRVNEIALSQLSNVEVDGAEMNAQKMAEMVLSGAQRHSWFDDAVSLGEAHAPPLSGAEAASLRESRRRLGQDLIYASARIPSSTALLPAADIGRLHEVLVDMREIEEAEAKGGLLALRATTPEVLADARKLLEAVEAAANLARELEETGEAWTAELRHKCRQATYASERQALEALFGEIETLIKKRAELLKRPVEVPEAALTAPKAREAVARAAETGKPFALFSIGTAEAKEQLAAIRVAGLAPTSADDWKHVQRYVLLHEQVLSFSVRWNVFAELLSVPRVEGGVNALRHIELVSVNARKAHQLATDHDAYLPRLAERVFAKPPAQQLKGTSSQLHEVQQHLRSHLTRAELAQAATQLATMQEKLAGTSGPISATLRTFVEKELGSAPTPVERIVARYSELVGEVRRIEALAHDIGIVNELARRIEKAGAPKLGAQVRTQPLGPSGEDEVFPVSWRDAWNWARVKAHLDTIDAREELRTLAARRRDLERGLARLYESMVSKAAWLSTKLGASPKVLSALETYRTAVRRIGGGTGPNAIRHRRDAQKAMLDAQGAVPCWVMSHAKVSETLPAQLGCFDLVIVDEASQSNLWALPAVLRGKKILVVGDDKQVSPDGGFISATHIQELKDRFLSDQPYAAVLTPEKSLYDLASTVFAANKVMLREHFRCVSPIIAYSNRTFYDNFIQPLRIPKVSERIDPPLVDIYVEGGTRRDVMNKQEAEAISEEIEAILNDRRFAGRTIGVVSLLGPDQAKYIDGEVRRRCDPAELLRRRFDCGDARLFQGSERDIVFLSMVVDPANCKAVSGNMFEQRFNVAASRARDRMYLVRSVQLSDLSQADHLRRGLLEHFSKPLDNSTDETKSLIDQCESGFEKQVYSELFSRGYRVVPQVRAGSFRIDMVVEGGNDTRLAIECDGDEFHGPDRWAADMSRQRILERAGWTFWRCFASTWAMRKDEVLQQLLDRLTAMGIEPLGVLERIPSLVEYRPWKRGGLEKPVTDAAGAALDAAIDASTGWAR